MARAFGGRRIGVVVLAGGTLEASLVPYVVARHKAWIKLGERMLIERVLDGLEPCAELERRVLVAEAAQVPDAVRARVKAVAPPGKGILDSLASGVEHLGPGYDLILAVPCDMPFLEPASVQGFLALCESRPGDVWYSYIRKECSEARYPGLRHTWVKLADGTFCGGGLVLFEASSLVKARSFMARLTELRKQPFRLASLLGLGFLWKLVRGKLAVADAEARATELLGIRARGIEAPYADVGFNVDAPEELLMAQCLVAGDPALS
jgi:molybdopterin-guanine dinucleotide biosynthesis protein A